jgi:UDP-glucose 4-epimerase
MSDNEKLGELLLKEKNIGAVIHFAAYKGVGESMQKPLEYFRNNLYSLVNLLKNMKVNKIKNIVFSSSATVYGDPDKLPVAENAPFKPALSAYGSTKQIGEDILKKVAATKDINCISLRYFNPVGADSSGLLGELPVGQPNNLMPFVTQTAAGIRQHLVVFGNDYDTPDGTCVRDYIHVSDLAKAHVKSCDRLLSEDAENNYEVFNLGTGEGISVLQIIEAFEKYNKVKLNYTIGKRRPGDAATLFADASLAKNILGWKAEFGLREMVTSAWEWQKIITANIVKS